MRYGISEHLLEASYEVRAMCSISIAVIKGESNNHRISRDHFIVLDNGNPSWLPDPDDQRASRIGRKRDKCMLNTERANEYIP